MNVAVVGAGISGLTLALRLQQLGVEVTLFAERSPEELRFSQIENLVARFPATRERERELGVAHWDNVDGCESWGIDVDVVGTPLGFRGTVARPVQGVDFRVYLSRLLEDYTDRGGSVVTGALPATTQDLVVRTGGHDVVVFASGRTAPVAAALFPVRADRTPFRSPQRRLCGGLYVGVAQTDPPTVSFNIVPGVGEIFQQPFLTRHGNVSAVLVEATPAGPLEPITRYDHAADLRGFAVALLDVIDAYAPSLAARIDHGSFAPPRSVRRATRCDHPDRALPVGGPARREAGVGDRRRLDPQRSHHRSRRQHRLPHRLGHRRGTRELRPV